MKRYRIKEYDYGHRKSYLLQRHLIFGIWYNPDNIDAQTTGWYNTLEEAKESIQRKLHKSSSRVVYEVHEIKKGA